MIEHGAAALLGYLLGGIPAGYLLVRLVDGSDVRDVGSGNIGATNVGRVLGAWGWTATLLADMAKGAGAVALAWLLWGSDPAPAAIAGYGAILGHCYTPWLRFRGGKGVATMLGTFLVLAPMATVGAAGVFALVAAVARIVSVASLAASVALPVLAWWVASPVPVVVVALATTVLVFLRHRDNIGRLMAGTEARVGGGTP